MDEGADLAETLCPWDIEDMSDECIVYRQVHYSQRTGKKPRRYPNETHFELREAETGLSFNWNRYADEKISYTILGLSHDRKGNYLNPTDYIVFKYPISFLRSIDKIKKIHHTPVYSESSPSPVGRPNNKSHVELEYDPEDLGVRVNLSDYCNKEYESARSSFDTTSIKEELEELRERLNDTPYHKDWVF